MNEKLFSKHKHEKQLAMANVLPGKYNLEMKVKVFSVTFCRSCLCGWTLAILYQVVKVYRLSVLTPTNLHIILTLSRVSETPTFLPSVGLVKSDFQVVGTLCFPSKFFNVYHH